MDLRLHFLEAAGSLDRWRPRMEIEAQAVSSRIDALVHGAERRHPVDVVVRRSHGLVIPELGIGGACYEASAVTIAVAPASENFETSFRAGSFGSTLAHELHHSLRHASCGYGASLGEAIVSEGLADRFSVEVTGCDRPIWTKAEYLDAALIETAESRSRDIAYDHAAWFFGRGSIPRWAGYTIGWHLVGAYLARHPDETAGTLAGVHADAILREGWTALRASATPARSMPGSD